MAWHTRLFSPLQPSSPRLTRYRDIGFEPCGMRRYPLQKRESVCYFVVIPLITPSANPTPSKIQKGEIRQGVLVEINEHQSWKWRHWCVRVNLIYLSLKADQG